MKNRVYGNRLRIRVKILLVAFVLILFCVYLESQVSLVIENVSAAKANHLGTEMIHTSISKVLKEADLDYQDLSEIQYDENRNVTAIEVNAFALNQLRGEITQEITKEISDLDTMSLSVPLGSLSGNDFLDGRGPKIPLKMYPNGYLTSQVVSQFDEAGINQTRHRIVLNISVNITSAIPFYKTTSAVKSEFVLAETVVVGTVPEYYTKVVTQDKELLQSVNDYGTGQQQTAK